MAEGEKVGWRRRVLAHGFLGAMSLRLPTLEKLGFAPGAATARQDLDKLCFEGEVCCSWR